MKSHLRATIAVVMTGASLWCASAEAVSKSITTQSRANISAILELAVAQQGVSEIKFGNIRPSAIDATVAGPISVQIDVTCNTGDKYQVTQRINGPLENAEGKKIDVANVTFKVMPEQTNGIGVNLLTPLIAAPQVIFTSNAEGASDRLLASYYLNVPSSQEPGNYAANITYTVSAI